MLLVWAVAALAGSWEDFGPMPGGNRLIGENVGPDLARFEIDGEGGHYWIDVTPVRARAPDEAAAPGDSPPPSGSFCSGGGLSLQVRKNLDDDHESFDLEPVPLPVKLACDQLGVAALPLRARMAAMTPVHTPGPDGEPVTQDVASSAPTTGAGVETSGWASPGHRAFARFNVRVGHAVVIAWAVAGMAALWAAARNRRRPRELGVPAAILGLALGLRLFFAPVTAILGGDAAYERLGLSFGRGSLDRYYGDTWPSLFGLLHELVQRIGVGPPLPSEVVHHVNLLASAATAPLLWGVCRRAGMSAYAAAAAGFGLAVLPHAVGLARIEDHAVLVGFLQVLTGFAVLGTSRADTALAVLSATLLAHLRPDQLPTASVLLLPLAARRQWAAFGIGAALIGSRLAYLPDHTGSNPIQFVRLLQPGDWRSMAQAWAGDSPRRVPLAYALAGFALAGALIPKFRPTSNLFRVGAAMAAVVAGAVLVFVPGSLRFVAPACVGLVVVAAAVPARADSLAPRTLAWIALVLGATTLIYLPKDLPAADPLRFSLPSEAWLLALAAVGAETLWPTWSSDRRITVAAACLLAVVGLAGVGSRGGADAPDGPAHVRPWVWEEEYRFLRDELPSRAAVALGGHGPPGDPVDLTFNADAPRGWYDDGQDPNGAFGRWLSVSTGMSWVPWTAGTPKTGDLVFRGSADRLAGRWTGSRCGLEPLVERETPPTSDGWVDFGAENVRFSLYSVRECGE